MGTASSLTSRTAEVFPEIFGLKVTLTVALWFVGTLIGVGGAVNANWSGLLPPSANEDMFRSAVPLLVIVIWLAAELELLKDAQDYD